MTKTEGILLEPHDCIKEHSLTFTFVNEQTQLLLNAIYAITGWIAAIAGACFHDRLGRRKMFLMSTGGMVVCLAIVAGGAAGYVQEGSIPASRASIAFIYVFGVVFAWAFTSMQPVYPAEVMTNDMRAKGAPILYTVRLCRS